MKHLEKKLKIVNHNRYTRKYERKDVYRKRYKRMYAYDSIDQNWCKWLLSE